MSDDVAKIAVSTVDIGEVNLCVELRSSQIGPRLTNRSNVDMTDRCFDGDRGQHEKEGNDQREAGG